MRKRVKKIFRIGMIFITIMLSLQMVRFAIETFGHTPSGNQKISGNYRHYATDECFHPYSEENYIGNSVLVHKKNGITTFPLVFGNRLYLYDIENDSFTFVSGTWFPFTEIGTLFMTAESKVYYTIPVWDEASSGGNMYCTDLDTKRTTKIPYDIGCYIEEEGAVYKNKLYYRKEYIDEDKEYRTKDYGIIFAADLDTQKEVILKKGEIEFFKVKGNKMYCYDRNKKELSITDLDSGKETIKKPSEKEYKMLAYNYTERKGRLYYDDDEYHVKQIDPDKNDEKIIIDLLKEEPFKYNKEYKENLWPAISYCDDYIAVENYYYSDYEKGDHSNLFIYDYNGKLLQKKQLW